MANLHAAATVLQFDQSFPGNLPDSYEGFDDVVAEVTVKVQAAQVAQCTDTAAVLKKLENLKF